MTYITLLFFMLYGSVQGTVLPNQMSTVAEPEMVLVSGGTYIMGCYPGRDTLCYGEEKPSCYVSISDFYMGRYEVTNAEYCRFLNEKGNQTEAGEVWTKLMVPNDEEICRVSKKGERFVVEKGYENHPIIFVNWYGATAYCAWLAETTGKAYRLPSEAEWEYAARGGNKSGNFRYSGSNNMEEVAWCEANSGNKVHAVGGKKPNELGICDMTGNVCEWCADDWYSFLQHAPQHGKAYVESPQRNVGRVYRGGAYATSPRAMRLSHRAHAAPVNSSRGVGFRLALSN